MTTTIASIEALPSSPYNGSGLVSIVITNGVPCYFKITGSELNKIISVDWYPENPASVLFMKRDIILISNTLGTFMITVIDNYLNDCDRKGRISFRLDDGNTLTAPVKTYGRVSLGPLWTAPNSGLITG